MAGRKKKPTNLTIVQGTFRKDRANNKQKVKGDMQSDISCSPWLDEEAKKEWQRVAPGLQSRGILTSVDRAALEAYCVAYARWQAAEKLIEEKGLTVATVNRDGGKMIRKNPAVGIAEDSMKIMRSFASEFGMTPSSNCSMNVTRQEPRDAFEDFLDS